MNETDEAGWEEKSREMPTTSDTESDGRLSLPSLWIFGYGSLIWKPNFVFSQKRVGFVNGYVRRFWQGCVCYRGVPGSPGRVATLVEEDQGTTWGVAFQVKGKEQIAKTLQLLNTRETEMGDYQLVKLDFTPQDSDKQFTAYAYIATPSNRHYLGPAPPAVIARSIAGSSGDAGPNTEYLFRLVEFMREVLPDIDDEHLRELDRETTNIVKSKAGRQCCKTAAPAVV